ncbi:MAG TPA: glycosyl hydrolase family 65 protein [Acidimicrobiales bacterium]|nr:glycosyl hydrolase family 65 protein [Acidimicrobiales bacterium]
MARGTLDGNQWELTYDAYDPDREPLREALCVVGNGYLATRGAAPEADAGGPHYPGTYLAGLYDRLTSEVAGREIENEDLVNITNWLPLTFRIDDGDWFCVDDVAIVEYRQTLDLRRGVLVRRIVFRDDEDRETSLTQRRFAHMSRHHLLGLDTVIRPENWSGHLTVRSGLDPSVRNQGVERYRTLADDHLDVLDTAAVDDDVLLTRTRTVQSRIEVVVGARHRLWVDDELRPLGARVDDSGDRIAHEIDLDVDAGCVVRFEKVAAVYTSRDHAISEPGLAAEEHLRHAADIAELLEEHVRAWDELWRRFWIRLDAQPRASLVLNVHIFHLLQTVSPNTADLDTGAPARGLHGEAYRGHIFWDELFVFPLLVYRVPEIARELLRYRYRRLHAAQRAAAEAGHAGAMFPWQSGSDGREESQVVHLNPKSGEWVPDNTHRQRHIGIAIAFNIWQYVQVTDDLEFLARFGAEMFVEIARFFASIATYDRVADRFDIHGVMGPDEFHTADPNWDGPGLRNNAYTNVMAAWVLTRALEVLDPLPELHRERVVDRLGITRAELERWDEISRKLKVPFHGDGIISQFEGYEDLDELDWDHYRERYGDIQRLDRILGAEGDSPNRYKASKQADVLMLFYLLSFEELQEVFARLGHHIDAKMLKRNVDEYLCRTSHGSTLSRIVHSWVMARTDRRQSWELFEQALESDVADIQGGTTSEGIHLGAMAGTIDLLERGFTGMAARKGRLEFKPSLPEELGGMEFQIYVRSRWITVEVVDSELRLTAEQTDRGPITVVFRGEERELGSGQTLVFDRLGDGMLVSENPSGDERP